MGKSILILDTPENCYDCEFLCEILYDNIACQVNGEPINDGNSKPDWCPLREISETDLLYEYQTIGTVEECREARERQKARKPNKKQLGNTLVSKIYYCPNCHKTLYDCAFKNGKLDYVSLKSKKSNFCSDCGQKLDWSEDDE